MLTTRALLFVQILLKKVSLSSTEFSSNAGEFTSLLATLNGGADEDEWTTLLTDICPEGQTINTKTEWKVQDKK